MNDQLILRNEQNIPELVKVRMMPSVYPRFSRISPEEAKASISKAIFQAYMYKGYNANKDNIKFISEALYMEIMEDRHNVGMRSISGYDIGYAIKKAVMDKEDFFFSVSYLYNVIKDFCLNDGHKALEEANKIIEKRKQQVAQLSQPMADQYAIALIKNHK